MKQMDQCTQIHQIHISYTYEDISDMQYTIKYIQTRIMIYRIDMQPKSESSHYKIGASVIHTTPALVTASPWSASHVTFSLGMSRVVSLSANINVGCMPAMARMGCPRDQGMLKFSTFTMHRWYMVVAKSQKASFDALLLRGSSSSEDSMISISK